MSDADRLTEAETKLAYLEQTVDTLNDVVIEQRAAIDALAAKFERLRADVETAAGAEPGDEKPPHY
jgi:SlyX protein